MDCNYTGGNILKGDETNNMSKSADKKNLYYEDEELLEKFNFSMLKRLWFYTKKYKKQTMITIGILLFDCILALVPSFLYLLIMNDILPKDHILPQGFLTMTGIVLIAFLLLYLSRVICQWVTMRLMNKLGNQIICDLRKELFEKLMKLSFHYYDSHPSGKILVRVTNYVAEVADIFVFQMTRILCNIITMAFCFIAVLWMDARIGTAVVISLIFLSILMYQLAKSLHIRSSSERNKISNLVAFIAENINGLDVIRAFNRADKNEEIQKELCKKHVDALMKTTHVREAFFPLAHGIVQIICIIVVYGTAYFLMVHGMERGLTLGIIVSVASYMQILSENLSGICQRIQNIASVTTNLERIFDTMDTEEEITDTDFAKDISIKDGLVEFKEVSFSYLRNTTVLENFSFTAYSGEMIALIGPTGAGKTTIVNLLSRFYDIDSGKITIDGHDIKEYSLSSLRSQVGVMMQDSFLFEGTIMENIRFSKPQASDEDCIKAAQKVCADEFICRLPDGYQTRIDEHTSLSGGERQLLAFARLMLADPRILILDEATSHIDTETEQRIQKAIAEFLKGRTSFVIAHRLSTIRNADRIVYIENKQIAEQGTHEQLLKKKGLYWKLLEQGLQI